MLLQAELDLVRRDRDLPGLAKLLEAEAFGDALRAAASDAEVRSASLRYLRYKPGQNCLAAYTLDVAGATVECHAKAYRLADADKFEKAGVRAHQPGPLGEGRFLWPRLGVEVCVFPNDNKLGSLALLADAVRREDFLRRHLPDRPDLWRSGLCTLAYKPERRWVGALELGGAPLAVCKLYGQTAFEEVRSKSKRFRSGEVLRLAPLIGRSKGRAALFYGWQQGQLLSQAMLEPSFNVANFFRVGLALAEFHRQPAVNLPVRRPEVEALAIVKLGQFLEFLLPSEAARIREIASQLASSLASLPAGHSVTHGDFYAKQVLVDGETITLLDLDEAVRGDAMDDLGTFLAHLERERIVGRLRANPHEQLRAELLNGYRSGGGHLDLPRIELRTAAGLFGRLPHFFRNRDAEWPRRTSETLSQVAAMLGSAHSPNSFRVALDSDLPALEGALQLKPMETLLAAALRERHPDLVTIQLRQASLLRHKPGRRALIQYELELCRDRQVETLKLLGKLRRRGVDAENLRKLKALSASRFAPDSADGIAMPELFGSIPELGMTLQRSVPGQRLGAALSQPGCLTAARRAADALCKLHHSTLRPEREHTIADEMEILAARFAALASGKPEWSARLDDLLRACWELAGQLPAVSPRPIHRDFYHDQLLLDGRRVWLLDLDLLCAGDPALDAGNFNGHLIEWGMRSPAERAALELAAAAFTNRFLELTCGARREAVEIYTTLTLARHVSISTQFAERAPFTAQLLELCEERVSKTAPRNHGEPLALSTP